MISDPSLPIEADGEETTLTYVAQYFEADHRSSLYDRPCHIAENVFAYAIPALAWEFR
jgi:hypothetical protein